MSQLNIKRVLLKISGEALLGNSPYGIQSDALSRVVLMIKELKESGVDIGIVIGGGNIFRGLQQGSSLGIERTRADQMGMLATLINGIALKDCLEQNGLDVQLMSALNCPTIAESYQWDNAMKHLANGKIVIFVGGTGNPYFTTDTCAALRASEIHAQAFLKATTRVDGIYSKDPLVHKDAVKYDQISYTQVLNEKLRILDLTAVSLCMTNRIPIKVFNLFAGSLVDAITKPQYGTLVTE